MSATPDPGGEPLGEREPTSHERAAGRPWDASYRDEEPAPWDLGRPQGAIGRLASRGVFSGSVLDAGCGTGEHSLLIASLGLSVLGVDVAATAIEIAREKAAQRNLSAEFAVADALRLERLGRRFETILDCGLFHSFEGDERHRYAEGLASVAVGGATVHLLCFGDGAVPAELGPHPVSRDEIHSAFDRASGWEVVAIEPELIEARFSTAGVPAWLATIERAGG